MPASAPESTTISVRLRSSVPGLPTICKGKAIDQIKGIADSRSFDVESDIDMITPLSNARITASSLRAVPFQDFSGMQLLATSQRAGTAVACIVAMTTPAPTPENPP
jgi:hypothetical protein